MFTYLVWTTKEHQPLIINDIEAKIYSYIISKADELETIIHAINGTENHIHIVASIPPNISISEFVQKVKGSRAALIILIMYFPHKICLVGKEAMVFFR
nr:transposase [Aphanizomenon flos-aquae]